jgi:hypothetical protein
MLELPPPSFYVVSCTNAISPLHDVCVFFFIFASVSLFFVIREFLETNFDVTFTSMLGIENSTILLAVPRTQNFTFPSVDCQSNFWMPAELKFSASPVLFHSVNFI